MTLDMTREVGSREVAAGDLDEQVAALAGLAERLGAPPRDRDALLWAAHEAVACARLLLEARAAGPVGERELLTEAVAQSRSATASLHYALRERA